MRARPVGALALSGWLVLAGTSTLALAEAPHRASRGLDVAAYPTGPQPRWTTLADGPRLPGNARPSCDSEHLGRSLAVDDNGDIYVSGLAAESNRFFLLKFNVQGDLLWQRELDSPYDLPSVPLLLHRKSGEPRVGLVVPEYRGYSVHTFSSEGAAVWNSTLVPVLPETRSFDARSAAYSEDGHAYVVGYRDYGSGFIARHSGDGEADWVSIEAGVDLGGVEVAGSTGIVSWGHGVDEPTIVKYDAQGNRLWSRTLTDAEGWEIHPNDLEVANPERLFFAGTACREGHCRPAFGALGADGSWLWSQVLAEGPGYESGFRALSIGTDTLHGLLDRGSSGAAFIDVLSFKTNGERLGVHSLGPFTEAQGAASLIDGRGWLRFAGSIRDEGSWKLILGSLSTAGVLSLSSYADAELAEVASCDLVEGSGGGLTLVGQRDASSQENSDLVVGLFSDTGTVGWTRHEPDMTSPGDGPGSRMGPDRKGPAAHRSADEAYWVVGGSSPPGGAQKGRPVAWRFSADGALLGTVAPFGDTDFHQWADSSATAANGGMAMAGATNAGTRFPFVAAFSPTLAETMRYVDNEAGPGWASAVFRADNGDFLVAQRTFELLRISPTGELQNRVTEESIAYLLNDSVVAEDDTVWMVGSAQPADLEVDCVLAGLSAANGLVWSRTFGLAGAAETCSSVDARGSRIVAVGRGSSRIFVVSYDAAGSLEWNLEDSDFEPPWSSIGQVLLDGTGSAWVSGRLQGMGTPALAKISVSGLVLWERSFEEESSGSPKFDLDGDGRCYVLVDLSTTWPVLFGLNSTGDVLWRSNLENAYSSLRVVSSGQVLLTGSRGNFHSNDLLVALVSVADFLFADGFESGDMTGWAGGGALSD